MAELFKSTRVAFTEESSENTYTTETSTTFVKVYDNFSMEPVSDTLASTELSDSIDASKPLINKQSTKGSASFSLKGSGVEGQAPQYSTVLKAIFGSFNDYGTEYDTISGSSAGSSATRGKVVVNTGEGANYAIGQALLIKGAVSTDGKYSVRNVYSISSDDLNLSFNTASGAASGTNLGQCQAYKLSVPSSSYTVHWFQDDSGAAFHQAGTGCKTTSLKFNFPANGRATLDVTFEGLKHFHNPISITSSNKYLNFNEGGSELTATMTVKTYQTPHELAREIEYQMDLVAAADITVSYSDTDGKFTIASGGATFQLLAGTGTNVANGIFSTIGFTASNKTGALTYTGTNAISFDPSVTPSYDTSTDLLVRDCEMLIGSFSDYGCRKMTSATININATRAEVLSFCATNGLDSSLLTERAITFEGNLIVDQYESKLFDAHVNNTAQALALTIGDKVSGNWTAGSVVNFYMPNVVYSAVPIVNEGSFLVYKISAVAYETGSYKPLYLNYL